MDSRMPNLNGSPAWEVMLLLLSWSMLSDTIPGMMALASLCAINAWLINNPRYYMRWFIIYAFMSYFAYFAHVWTWNWEQKIKVDLPFYDTTLGIVLAGEVLIFIELLEKIRGKRIFIISNVKDWFKKTAQKLMDDRLNNIVIKKGK